MCSGRSPLLSSLSLLLLLLLSLLAGGHRVAEGSTHRHGHGHRHHHHHHPHGHHLRTRYSSRRAYSFQPTKLFVFGDSYADTGNNRKAESNSWKIPYGITFPGKPSGRFSSGRVLTDYFAKSFGMKSPIPYRWRQLGGQHLLYGVNFAYGGTGVFDTPVHYPNMTAQIDMLEELIRDKTFSAGDVSSSVALVTLSGNDYSAYNDRNGTAQGLPAFITAVVDQLSKNLRRLYELGARKVAVTALQPLGCLPTRTVAYSFSKCDDTVNLLVGLHNQLLHQAVASLNNRTSSSTFVVVDLFGSFMSVLNGTGGVKFENPMKPCCVGASGGYGCGSVDGNGTRKYTVCEDPESAFFWDSAHPTQAGWRAVFWSLAATLQQL